MHGDKPLHEHGGHGCLRSRAPVPGPDGEQPPPGDPARDDGWDGDAALAAYFADLDAGRARIPEEWEIEGPAATLSLGDAAGVDLAELAAMLGPDGLGGEVFAQHRSADAMRPGPVLAALSEQAAALAEFLRQLNVTVTPIATGTCDHRNAEDRYVPSRKLGHLIRARTATCPAPGCGAHACHNDLDHTVAYPGGPTDECNLAPQCRR